MDAPAKATEGGIIMDQLDKDAVAATRAGMSYGQYIAKCKPPAAPAVRFPKKKAEPARGQEKRPLCAICGEPIPSTSKNRKYCGPDCSYAAMRQQQRVIEARRREEKRRLRSAAEE